MISDLLRGIPRNGGVVNIALAGVANATVIYRISNWAQQVGTKSFVLKRLLLRNNAGGQGFFFLGTGVGAAFAQVIPPVLILNNIDNVWQETELPWTEVWADLTAYPAALVAGGSVDVQVEVEERG